MIRIVKWKTVGRSLTPIGIALVIGYLIIMISGHDPNEAYLNLFTGSFGSKEQIANTFFSATPLIFTGLATAISFKAGLYNMGAEGQLYLGAFTAALLGFSLKGLPGPIHVCICLFGGALAGFLFALIPAVIKAYLKVDEMVSTLMLNYVAILFTSWLASYPYRAPGSSNPETVNIYPSAVLGRIFEGSQLHIGFIIALVTFGLIYYMSNYTLFGYQIKAIGQNVDFSQFVGMKVSQKIVQIMCLSGIISGLGGAIEVLGTHGKFISGFSADYGWTGLTVALIGRFEAVGVFLASIVFGALKSGGSTMEIMTGVPRSLITIIEGMIVLFFTVQVKYKRSKALKAKLAKRNGGNQNG